MKKTTSFVAVYPLVLGMTLLETGAALGQPGVGPDITWVEKYVTYAQDSNGDLRLTDVHFLSEVVFDVFDDMKDVTARLYAGDLLVATYDPSSDKSAFTNGFFYTRKTRSFDSLADLDGTWPPDTRFRWEIQYPDRVEVLQEIRIGGPEERTQVPRPSPITLAQGTAAIEPGEAIDSARPLTMSWLPFEEGAPLGGFAMERFYLRPDFRLSRRGRLHRRSARYRYLCDFRGYLGGGPGRHAGARPGLHILHLCREHGGLQRPGRH